MTVFALAFVIGVLNGLRPDFYVALVEDLICVAGALWVVTRFQ